jgi:thermolysin
MTRDTPPSGARARWFTLTRDRLTALHSLSLLAAIALVMSAKIEGQQSSVPVLRAINAPAGAEAAWAARTDTMLHDGALDIRRVEEDTMIAGRSHERLDQRYENLPVFGGQIVRQMNGRNTVSVFGQVYENVTLPTRPSLDAAAAALKAEQAAGEGARAAEPVLGILAVADRYALVYRTRVTGPWDIRTYFINAETGAVEQTRSELRHQTAAAVVGRGTGVLSDPKKVSAVASGDLFEAIDRLRPASSFTLDFHGNVLRLSDFLESGFLFFSDVAVTTDNIWNDGAVVDAHVYQGWVYDYYFKRFGRRGLDGNDVELLSVVHPLARNEAALFTPDVVAIFVNNAIYIHPALMMYGDGDGRNFDYLAGGFDVVAHELTHGVTAYSSDLDYRDEPGALNEAFSDIMATAMEFYFFKPGTGPQKGPNFVIGEDVTKFGAGYLRSLQDPHALGAPDHYSLRQFVGTSVDDGGVHFNSTIASHAFYLAVAGGTNRVSGVTVRGVGLANIERMERIFYRAFVFLMGPQSRFSDARAATLQAATDLYGAASDERAQVAQAWTAVGVQ